MKNLQESKQIAEMQAIFWANRSAEISAEIAKKQAEKVTKRAETWKYNHADRSFNFGGVVYKSYHGIIGIPEILPVRIPQIKVWGMNQYLAQALADLGYTWVKTGNYKTGYFELR
jgi:uncharacterized membrane protein YqiK